MREIVLLQHFIGVVGDAAGAAGVDVGELTGTTNGNPLENVHDKPHPVE
ncbi:MAG TPA: hypothetical protein VHB79_07845 [Polyangiaceae bacterium]|nr:hypothetical protein [Polyangiaceae bacterium]